MSQSCHSRGAKKSRPDLLLWGSVSIILSTYLLWFGWADAIQQIPYLNTFAASTFELLNEMYWGMALGVLFVGILDKIPREMIMKVLGKGGTFAGIWRATAAGVLLDLCSHGILIVGMKLYKKGASLGQVMAFLIASPWNSISLTLILWALVGFWWMITFLLLSMLMAVISGVVFDKLVAKGFLPKNPNRNDVNTDFAFWPAAGALFKEADYSAKSFGTLLVRGFKGSRMILRWIFFGMVLAAAVRTFVPTELFGIIFGPTIAGLVLTLLIATLLEVCSEGSTPIAADILTKALAPGNSFAFLMTGVSTDYTEIMALKETTGSWKISFALPLLTIPQILVIAIILNNLTL